MFSLPPAPPPAPSPIEFVMGTIELDLVTQDYVFNGLFLPDFLKGKKISAPLTVVHIEGAGLNVRFWDTIQKDFEENYLISIEDYLKLSAFQFVRDRPLDSIVIRLYVQGGEIVFYHGSQYVFAERMITQELRAKVSFVSPKVSNIRTPATSTKQVLNAIAAFFRQNKDFKEGWDKKHNQVTIDDPILRVKVFTKGLASRGYEAIDFIILIKPIKGKEAIISINASGRYVMVGRYPYRGSGSDMDEIFRNKIKDEKLLLYVHDVFIPALSKFLAQKKMSERPTPIEKLIVSEGGKKKAVNVVGYYGGAISETELIPGLDAENAIADANQILVDDWERRLNESPVTENAIALDLPDLIDLIDDQK